MCSASVPWDKFYLNGHDVTIIDEMLHILTYICIRCTWPRAVKFHMNISINVHPKNLNANCLHHYMLNTSLYLTFNDVCVLLFFGVIYMFKYNYNFGSKVGPNKFLPWLQKLVWPQCWHLKKCLVSNLKIFFSFQILHFFTLTIQ